MDNRLSETCPNCGDKELARGLHVHAKGMRNIWGFRRGSWCKADVCKSCGFVVKLWVDNPKIDKSTCSLS